MEHRRIEVLALQRDGLLPRAYFGHLAGLDLANTKFKRIVLNPRFNYYQADRGRTSLRDFRFDATVRLANDLGLHAGQDFDYHAPRAGQSLLHVPPLHP